MQSSSHMIITIIIAIINNDHLISIEHSFLFLFFCNFVLCNFAIYIILNMYVVVLNLPLVVGMSIMNFYRYISLFEIHIILSMNKSCRYEALSSIRNGFEWIILNVLQSQFNSHDIIYILIIINIIAAFILPLRNIEVSRSHMPHASCHSMLKLEILNWISMSLLECQWYAVMPMPTINIYIP